MSWWEVTAHTELKDIQRYRTGIAIDSIEYSCLTLLADMLRSGVAPAFRKCALSLHSTPTLLSPSQPSKLAMTSTANSESIDCLLLSLYCRLAQPVKCAFATGEGGLKHKILPSNPRPPSSETLSKAELQLLQEAGPMRVRRHIVHYPIGTARPSTAALCTARQGKKGEAFISTPPYTQTANQPPQLLR
jgi:hypothetical protein